MNARAAVLSSVSQLLHRLVVLQFWGGRPIMGLRYILQTGCCSNNKLEKVFKGSFPFRISWRHSVLTLTPFRVQTFVSTCRSLHHHCLHSTSTRCHSEVLLPGVMSLPITPNVPSLAARVTPGPQLCPTTTDRLNESWAESRTLSISQPVHLPPPSPSSSVVPLAPTLPPFTAGLY